MCELWVDENNPQWPGETVRFCVARATGTLVSANRSAWQWDAAGHRNITEIGKSVLHHMDPDPDPALFAVPNRSRCVDLRPLPPARFARASGAGGDGGDVDDPARIARITEASRRSFCSSSSSSSSSPCPPTICFAR